MKESQKFKKLFDEGHISIRGKLTMIVDKEQYEELTAFQLLMLAREALTDYTVIDINKIDVGGMSAEIKLKVRRKILKPTNLKEAI